MIEIRNLTKRFEDLTAVDNLSFQVERGQTLALLGTSGCGKTTTLKMINRLIEPTSGGILVEGKNVMEEEPEKMRRKMGYVIQDTGLFPHYTVEENIATVPDLLSWPKEETVKRVNHLLQQLGLPASAAKKYPDQLSGGQQQRVGIARALAADPPIILMDEPFGALDPITRRQLRSDFRNLEELSRKTTIIVTHDVEEAFELSDIICLLDKGKVQQIGTPKDLLFHPANEFVTNFLDAQRLSLEMEVTQIKDLLPYLKATELMAQEDLPDIEGHQSIRSIISQMEKEQTGWAKIQEKAFNFPALMDAFHKFRLS